MWSAGQYLEWSELAQNEEWGFRTSKLTQLSARAETLIENMIDGPETTPQQEGVGEVGDIISKQWRNLSQYSCAMQSQ